MASSATRPESSSSPFKVSRESKPPASLQAVGAQPRVSLRRPTKQASYELCNHAKAYLEGGQYASGYDFLSSLLAAGASISKPETPYIGYLAPPAYIALASSLVVYPKLTTRTHSRASKKGADAALRYLRCIHTTIDGPAYPALRRSFFFPKEKTRRRTTGHRSAAGSRSPELGGDVDAIAGDAANAQSLWTRAEDFWHAVGWAFNCSVVHKSRWSRWKLWLTHILDFLETDWEFCVSFSNDEEAQANLQETLLWHYIAGYSESVNRGARRRIVKAILAAATQESLREFPKVWEDETAKPKSHSVKNDGQRLVDIDFETGNTGDYDSDEHVESSSDEASDVEIQTIADGGIRTLKDVVQVLGGIDAIDLRQRLIALLMTVATYLPAQFTSDSDLSDTILEDFNQLPIMVFQLLLSTMKMPSWHQVAFQTNLLLPLVSSKVPDHFHYEPSQDDLETLLLPMKGATRSFVANARISLILEQLMIYMIKENRLIASDALRQAIEVGIKARHSVFGSGKGRKSNAKEEEQAQIIMRACSDRMLSLLEVVEMAAVKNPQSLKPAARGVPALSSFMSGSTLSSPPSSDQETS